jgi:hypothetical protein
MSVNRAVVVDPDVPGRLVIRPVGEPSPDRGEAVVHVRALSLNRGEVRRSGMAPAGWRPGWDLAGVVERAAADGSGPRVDARVVGLLPEGAWAERVAVPAHALAELPDKVTFSQAATFPVAGLTALHALARGGPLLGRRVLVTGATGGVGDFAVQLARLAGAHVTASARRADQTAALRQLGAHEVAVGDEIAATPKYDIHHRVGGRAHARHGAGRARARRRLRHARRLGIVRGHVRRADVLSSAAARRSTASTSSRSWGASRPRWASGGSPISWRPGSSRLTSAWSGHGRTSPRSRRT